MNERIRELIEQATKVVEPNDPDYRHEVFDREKFAELIVKECIPFVGDVDSIKVKQMKDHFGINK